MRWCLLAAFLLVSALVPAGSALPTAVDDARVQDLWSARWSDPSGTMHQGVDGEGVVMLELEGFDATHPDLDDCADPEHHTAALGRVVSSVAGPVAGEGPPDAPRNDQGGHGNHIAGILCGSGEMSDGRIRGIAHGATLFSNSPLCACNLSAWFQEHNLRAVSYSINSSVMDRLETLGMPDDADVLISWAAGNGGGDGVRATTHRTSDPRVLTVAAANGDRTDVASYSSRGAENFPATWPDLTAPGCMFSVTPAPWADYHAIGLYREAHETIFEMSDCPDYPLPQIAEFHARGYTMQAGTSMAAPVVAGIAALMFQVNPDLPAVDAKHLLTRTADPFLPAEDLDGDDQVSPEEFRAQHGYKAGWGLVNATAAVAAAHYMALHPQATPAEAVQCAQIGSLDGTLTLNPSPSRCPGETTTRASKASPVPNSSAEPMGNASVEDAAPPESDPTTGPEPSRGNQVGSASVVATILAFFATVLTTGRQRTRG